MTALLSWSTGFCVLLALFACLTVAPYTYRKLTEDWRILRGQFGLGFVFICAGIAGRLGIAWWWFWGVHDAKWEESLSAMSPWIVAANILIAIGIAICLRLTSLDRYTWPFWAAAITISAIGALIRF